jgi:hypothetical protein
MRSEAKSRKISGRNACKECGQRLPTKKAGLVNLACRMLGLCRYCYRAKFSRQGGIRQVYQKHLTPWERAQALRRQFEGVEVLIWSPDFYQEWLQYVQAVERGELIL